SAEYGRRSSSSPKPYFAAARSSTGIAASMTSGPMPSPPMTAIGWVFTVRPSDSPTVRRSFEARRAPAAGAVAPADVHFTATRGTAQLARRRLAALGAEVHLPPPGERFAAIGTLARGLALLRQLVVLMGRDLQGGAVRAVRDQPLVDLRSGEGHGEPPGSVLRQDPHQPLEQAIQVVRHVLPRHTLHVARCPFLISRPRPPS